MFRAAGFFSGPSAWAFVSLAACMFCTSAEASVLPSAPMPDPTEIQKNRFISFSNHEPGLSAIRVNLIALHHVNPPYTGAPSTPFTQFEGQALYVGPPTRYIEAAVNGIPLYAAALQCQPFYHDWSTVELLHVSGEAVVPSSTYGVEILRDGCQGQEDECALVSPEVLIRTSRWGVVVDAIGPAPERLPDFSDVSAVVDKFRNTPDAPDKAVATLSGEGSRGLVDLKPEIDFSQISVVIDAFRGQPYPHKPGKCTNNSAQGCLVDADCSYQEAGPGVCLLCGSVSGGACCHSDGTCDVVPEYFCASPGDRFMGEGEPCSRCCGPSGPCRPLTNAEWFEAQQLWPNLDRRDICREAETDPTYNCVAWTLDHLESRIWDELDLDGDGLFETAEFETFFADFQKSAIIYGSNHEAVLHTAKPLANNCASTKAGDGIRIRHDRNQLEGGFYGDILQTYAY